MRDAFPAKSNPMSPRNVGFRLVIDADILVNPNSVEQAFINGTRHAADYILGYLLNVGVDTGLTIHEMQNEIIRASEAWSESDDFLPEFYRQYAPDTDDGDHIDIYLGEKLAIRMFVPILDSLLLPLHRVCADYEQTIDDGIPPDFTTIVFGRDQRIKPAIEALYDFAGVSAYFEKIDPTETAAVMMELQKHKEENLFVTIVSMHPELCLRAQMEGHKAILFAPFLPTNARYKSLVLATDHESLIDIIGALAEGHSLATRAVTLPSKKNPPFALG